MEDRTLIHFVKKNECLYNHKHKDFKNKMLKCKIWDKIAYDMGKPVKDVKQRFTCLRMRYGKVKKTQKGSDWPLYKYLDFLDEHIIVRSFPRDHYEEKLKEVRDLYEKKIHYVKNEIIHRFESKIQNLKDNHSKINQALTEDFKSIQLKQNSQLSELKSANENLTAYISRLEGQLEFERNRAHKVLALFTV